MVFAAPAVLLLAGGGIEAIRQRLEGGGAEPARSPSRSSSCAGIGPAAYHLAVPRERHEVRPVIQFLVGASPRPKTSCSSSVRRSSSSTRTRRVRVRICHPNPPAASGLSARVPDEKPYPNQELLDGSASRGRCCSQRSVRRRRPICSAPNQATGQREAPAMRRGSTGCGCWPWYARHRFGVCRPRGRSGPTFDEPFYVQSGLEAWRTGATPPCSARGTMPLAIDVATLPAYVYERWSGTPLDTSADLAAILTWARGASFAFWWLLLFYAQARLAGWPDLGRDDWPWRSSQLSPCSSVMRRSRPRTWRSRRVSSPSPATSRPAARPGGLATRRRSRPVVRRRACWPRRRPCVFGPLCLIACQVARVPAAPTTAIRPGINRFVRDAPRSSRSASASRCVYCGSDWRRNRRSWPGLTTFRREARPTVMRLDRQHLAFFRTRGRTGPPDRAWRARTQRRRIPAGRGPRIILVLLPGRAVDEGRPAAACGRCWSGGTTGRAPQLGEPGGGQPAPGQPRFPRADRRALLSCP